MSLHAPFLLCLIHISDVLFVMLCNRYLSALKRGKTLCDPFPRFSLYMKRVLQYFYLSILKAQAGRMFLSNLLFRCKLFLAKLKYETKLDYIHCIFEMNPFAWQWENHARFLALHFTDFMQMYMKSMLMSKMNTNTPPVHDTKILQPLIPHHHQWNAHRHTHTPFPADG